MNTFNWFPLCFLCKFFDFGEGFRKEILTCVDKRGFTLGPGVEVDLVVAARKNDGIA